MRLQQGDYERETIFHDDPVATAKEWLNQGAECLHLVDLDGARDGTTTNYDSIRDIVSAVDIPCEVGGGIRDESSIQSMIDHGVNRLVIGTKALKDPDWFQEMVEKFPDRLVLGIDARNGKVATNGWLQTSEMTATELAKKYESHPILSIVYTDIARDGMLSGPNIRAMREMKEALSVPVIASGGVSSVEDVVKLAQARMDGCIVGRALYEGTVTLSELISAARSAVEAK